MKTYQVKIALITSTVVGVGLLFAPQTVEASYYNVGQIHNYTPKSYRGTWYAYVDGQYTKTYINEYSVTQTFKGHHTTMFKSSWSGYRKLAVARIRGSKAYTFNALAQYGYQTDRGWRLTYRTIAGKKYRVLRDYGAMRSYADLFKKPIHHAYVKE